MIYLDYAAATPIDPEVLLAMQPWLAEQFSNPSSIYQSAQGARVAVDDARSKVADFLNCKVTEVYLTASGTESCNWALRGVVEQRVMEKKPVHLIVSSIEHSAVLETAKYLEKLFGIEVTYLPVNREGIVELAELEKTLKPETALVSIMMVNNEIGTIQLVAEIGKLCREKGVLFHTDACQASGYFDLDVKQFNVDLMTLNASKIYGPKGVGVLFVRQGVSMQPYTFGGGQEFKMRAGTENVAGIVGMGKAVELVRTQDGARVLELRNKLWEKIEREIEGVYLNGSLEQRVPNNLNFRVDGVDGEAVVRRLDLKEIAISTGSACASGKVEPSHVLLALGLSEKEARSSIRVTLGKQSTEEEINTFADTLVEVVRALRS